MFCPQANSVDRVSIAGRAARYARTATTSVTTVMIADPPSPVTHQESEIEMEFKRNILNCSGLDLEVVMLGEGEPLLYLNSGLGPDISNFEHLRALARNFRVIAPLHPGFGHLDRPSHFREVSDLAYLYLTLIDGLGISHGTLVGASFGGWVAAEMLVRKPDAMAHLVLSAPLGIKVRGREDRDIADFFAMTEAEFHQLAFAQPSRAKRDIGLLDDNELTAHFRSQESLAAYGWKPYMHNPQLKQWLDRIELPTLLVSGEADRFVFDGYHAAYAKALPNAKHVCMADAGHLPHFEQAEAFSQLVVETFSSKASGA